MRIGLLTSSYPRHGSDPSGSFVASMARGLGQSGDGVEVLCPSPHPGGVEPGGVSVRPVRYARQPRVFYGAGAPDNLAHSWRARLQAPVFVASLARDVWRRSAGWTHLLSHWLLPCGVAAAVAGRGLPHLAVAHSSDVHLLARLPGAGGVLHALARPRTRLLCTCMAIRDKLLPLCRSRRARRLVRGAAVMRMGFEQLPAPVDPGPRARSVLFLGRLVPVKGIDLLLHALAGVAGAELWIAGEGPERPRLERLAAELGVAATFFGVVAGEKKARLLHQAGALALPSRVLGDGRTDAAPVVLLEAMAAGLPVVATRVGGNAELIADGQNGLLVQPEDAAALGRALTRALDDDGTLAGAGRATAEEHTWERLTPRVRGILLGV